MRLLRPEAAAGVLAAALLLAVPAVATAQARQTSPPTAQVRIAHLSPDASYVDVYAVSLNRDQVFPNVFYKTVSAYWESPPGASPTRSGRPAPTRPRPPRWSCAAGSSSRAAATPPRSSGPRRTCGASCWPTT